MKHSIWYLNLGHVGKISQTMGGYDWLIYLDGGHTNQETGGMEASFNKPSLLLLCIHELIINYSAFKGLCYHKNALIVPFTFTL